MGEVWFVTTFLISLFTTLQYWCFSSSPFVLVVFFNLTAGSDFILVPCCGLSIYFTSAIGYCTYEELCCEYLLAFSFRLCRSLDLLLLPYEFEIEESFDFYILSYFGAFFNYSSYFLFLYSSIKYYPNFIFFSFGLDILLKSCS